MRDMDVKCSTAITNTQSRNELYKDHVVCQCKSNEDKDESFCMGVETKEVNSRVDQWVK